MTDQMHALELGATGHAVGATAATNSRARFENRMKKKGLAPEPVRWAAANKFFPGA